MLIIFTVNENVNMSEIIEMEQSKMRFPDGN